MDSKRPRPIRHAIRANAQIADSVSGQSVSGPTSDVSLAGCFVETPTPLEVKSIVRINLTHGGATVATYGDVVRSERGKGMGLRFRGTAPDQLAVWKRWLFALDRPEYCRSYAKNLLPCFILAPALPARLCRAVPVQRHTSC